MWSGIPISLIVFQFVLVHTVKGFGIVNEAEVGGFLELSCFLDDPTDVGNLISASSAFSNSSLNREHISHSKHPLPTTQEKTLHLDITRWSIPKSD